MASHPFIKRMLLDVLPIGANWGVERCTRRRVTLRAFIAQSLHKCKQRWPVLLLVDEAEYATPQALCPAPSTVAEPVAEEVARGGGFRVFLVGQADGDGHGDGPVLAWSRLEYSP